MPRLIDLRSDTVTRPTPAMREVMAQAAVGDDVFQEDPTVQELEDAVARLLGKEAALFVPSGTMCNQIAIRGHTQPGDELLCDGNCHIVHYETGAPAALSGVMCRSFYGKDGILTADMLEGQVKGEADYLPHTRLICLENTHNRGGGKIYPLENIAAIARWACKEGVKMHLDGARLWNASVATGIPMAVWASHFDTISVCFSKGLGAPVGSALVGKKQFIQKARRIRKMFGGGMRQAGILAAAALYAMKHHVSRLAEDHTHAQRLAERLTQLPGLSCPSSSVDTNILFIQLEPRLGEAETLVAKLASHHILVLATARHTLRFVTHLDVSAPQIEQTADVVSHLLSRMN
ncbi:MAG TPA: GntG family PLP-dependent aldolase [Gemmatales bacterium]|nr:GntG family PLP-dependent aldolase [Gemmatales bacterium]